MKPKESYEKHEHERWREVAVTTSQEVADIVSNKLIELGSQGTIFEELPDEPAACVIKAFYPRTTDETLLLQQIGRYLDELRQLGADTGKAELHVTEIDSADWSSNWKRFFKPLRVGKHLVIKPSWEAFDAEPDDIVIEIDPGMAFGTGLHASTRLCLKCLEQYIHPGDNVLDVGVGSGILSIAAAHLGADYVLGLDVDVEAIDIARENIRLNARLSDQPGELENRIELRIGSIDTLPIAEKFDCIMMNIRPNIIVPLIPYTEPILQTGGALILSGILEEEGADLIHEIRTLDLLVQNHAEEDGWSAYVLSQMDNAAFSPHDE